MVANESTLEHAGMLECRRLWDTSFSRHSVHPGRIHPGRLLHWPSIAILSLGFVGLIFLFENSVGRNQLLATAPYRTIPLDQPTSSDRSKSSGHALPQSHSGVLPHLTGPLKALAPADRAVDTPSNSAEVPKRRSGRKRPNVLMIISDDQAWTDYGFMGHPVIQTPNLDRLAKSSACFPRGYVPTALCRPSLATMISGLYPHQHGITGNDPSVALAPQNSEEYRRLREALISKVDSLPTLPKLLKSVGYRSFQSGKWWEGHYTRGGFDEGMTRGFPQPGGRHGDDGLKIGREGLQPIFDFMRRANDNEEPFFVWYAPFLPHTPHNPPDRLLNLYRDKVESPQVATYYAMCHWFDETVGELTGFVEGQGWAEDTLIVYVGDNGWIQDPESPRYAPRSKQSPYEGGVRQPILLSWPGQIPAGERLEWVSSVDLLPTILSVAGVLPPAECSGTDLMRVLEGKQSLATRRLYGEGFAHDVADLNTPETSLIYRWVIEDGWKLILTYDGKLGRYATSHPRKPAGPQLFQLLEDPHEHINRAADDPERVARMRKALDEWWLPQTTRPFE